MSLGPAPEGDSVSRKYGRVLDTIGLSPENKMGRPWQSRSCKICLQRSGAPIEGNKPCVETMTQMKIAPTAGKRVNRPSAVYRMKLSQTSILTSASMQTGDTTIG